MENPYQPPSLETKTIAEKPLDSAKSKWPVLCWQLPIIGFGALTTISVSKPEYGAIGGFIFIGSVLVGFVLSVGCLIWGLKHRCLSGHTVGGLFVNFLFGSFIVWLIYIAHKDRVDAEKAQKAHMRELP